MKKLLLMAILAVSFLISGCFGSEEKTEKKSKFTQTLFIIAGSESKVIQPIINAWGRQNGVNIHMKYMGSVDMMLGMGTDDFHYDVVLPANSMWIRLGDKKNRVKEEASIMRSPVVLGIKRKVAADLGWIDKDVYVKDILAAIKSGKLRFAVTSATQSNSGASSYMGILNALAGSPDVLSEDHLENKKLRENIRAVYKGVERGSGSSGWLKDLFVKRYDFLDAMINYESMVINANFELVKQGKEPLYVVYPVDGLAVADSTMGFYKRNNNANKLESYIKLRDYLLTPAVQAKISETGFRTGLIGMNPDKVDKNIFRKEWGIDVSRTISPIKWPNAQTIEKALNLYQTVFRKPSFTIYLLDISGSMKGPGIREMKDAMTTLLDPELSKKYLLQTSEKDISVIIPFNVRVAGEEMIEGNNPEALRRLLGYVNQLQANDGTNIYAPVIKSLEIFNSYRDRMESHLPAIILLTDGVSNNGTFSDVVYFWQNMNAGFSLPPIFSVTFGNASDNQLKQLSEYSDGRVFNGKKDGLIKAFKSAKGYN